MKQHEDKIANCKYFLCLSLSLPCACINPAQCDQVTIRANAMVCSTVYYEALVRALLTSPLMPDQ